MGFIHYGVGERKMGVSYTDLLRGMFNYPKPEQMVTMTCSAHRDYLWSMTTKERRQVHYHAARPGRKWK